MNLDKLISILTLKKNLFRTNMEQLSEEIKSFKIEKWTNHILLNRNKYSKKKIYSDSLFEIVIITWLPHQHTKIHQHPKNGCIMKILKGSLNEIQFQKEKIIENRYNQGDTTYIHDKIGSHIISNIDSSPCISLHIYSPPGFYDK